MIMFVDTSQNTSISCHVIIMVSRDEMSPLRLVHQSNRPIGHTGHLTLKVLVATIDAQWEGMGDVGSARNEPALLPPCPTIRVLSYSS